LELHDRLRLAVLEHRKILAAQAGSRPPALLDDDLDAHELDVRRGQDGGGRLRRLRAQRVGTRQDAKQVDEWQRPAPAFAHGFSLARRILEAGLKAVGPDRGSRAAASRERCREE
jgi:hypothetical protein